MNVRQKCHYRNPNSNLQLNLDVIQLPVCAVREPMKLAPPGTRKFMAKRLQSAGEVSSAWQ